MNKYRDSKGRFLGWLNIKKVCSKCGTKLNKYSKSKSLCKKCYLSNISGKNNPSWKGGLINQENYMLMYNRMYRKKRGKFYIQGCNNRRKVQEDLTIETIQQVYEENIKEYGTLTCYLCYIAIQFGDDSLDHKIPISRREEFPDVKINDKSNLGVAHISCNCRKHTKTESEYRKVGVL